MSNKDNEKYLEILNKGYFYSTEQFDKAVLYVSSGSLGLSITFIEKIVPLDNSQYKWLLLLSWLFEAITIILFTVNHYISKQAFNNEIKQIHVDENKKEKNDLWVKRLNRYCICTLLSGLLLFIIFIYINI